VAYKLFFERVFQLCCKRLRFVLRLFLVFGDLRWRSSRAREAADKSATRPGEKAERDKKAPKTRMYDEALGEDRRAEVKYTATAGTMVLKLRMEREGEACFMWRTRKTTCGRDEEAKLHFI